MHGAFGYGVEQVVAAVYRVYFYGVVCFLVLGDDDFGKYDGCRGCHDRGREQVAGECDSCLGVVASQHAYVCGHDGSGDGCHTGCHDEEYFGTVHPGEVFFGKQGCFALSEEDVSGHGESFGSGDAEYAFEAPGEELYYFLYDVQVV